MFASFQIDELSPTEVQTLFIRYLSFLKIEIQQDDAKFFLQHLHGIPAQVIYTINLINSTNVQEAKYYINDIDEFDEVSAYKVLDYLKNDELCRQILIGLSKFEIISYDLIHQIYGDNEEVYRSLQKIFDLGLFYNVSSTHQYLKINNSVADYINRSKLNLDNIYSRRLKEIIKASVTQPLELNENTDYSEFLISIQELLRSGQSVPPKYLIPSFILKAIVQEYYGRNYKIVIQLSKKILESSSKFDSQIIREIKFWLCQAYAWEHNSAFFDEVKYFNNNGDEGLNKKDYFFLLGFYSRVNDSPERALEYFNEVLKLDDDHPKTLRELVTIYLKLGRYADALKLAEHNYESHKSNIHNINAYFTCIINKPYISKADAEKLQELLRKAKESLHKSSEEFHINMLGEYVNIVEGQPKKAIDLLQEYMIVNRGSYHTFKKIIEICKNQGWNNETEQLKQQYPNMA